ncbi:phosphoribosylglycinamide formyltransferase [Terrabacter sp. NPDC080008]|uniref:phosphoribosylglycinamide formyltransferase n=1 Tax=Terrabacter sp. NPDC080008 TaxID=3155176 RepID=UPI00344C6AB3
MTTDAAARPSEPGPQPDPVPVVVLVSGSGTLLQALLDASAEPGYGVRVVAVGADRECPGLERAARTGVETFVVPPGDYADRAAWDLALAERVAKAAPRFVVTAGFMRILGPATLGLVPVVNTHPALLPSFPGAHGVRDALAYGVKVTGTTCHVVDAGVDTGPIIEQRVVAVEEDDTEDSLHERIKVQERDLLVDVVRRLAREGFAVDGRRVRIGQG